MWWLRGVFILFVLGCLGVAGAGAFRIVQDETGTRASATVSDCSGYDGRYTHVTCTGSWVVGGDLLGNGHVVVGDVSGAGYGDIGKTIDVTVRGDTAYTRGIGLGIGLLVGGLVIGVGLTVLTVVIW
jgi:hypothetical protein